MCAYSEIISSLPLNLIMLWMLKHMLSSKNPFFRQITRGQITRQITPKCLGALSFVLIGAHHALRHWDCSFVSRTDLTPISAFVHMDIPIPCQTRDTKHKDNLFWKSHYQRQTNNYLQFSPKSTFITSNTVHNLSNIVEMWSKFFLKTKAKQG